MASKVLKIGFIGGGQMAQAMAKGFLAAGLTKADRMTSSCHPLDLQSAAAFKALGAKSYTENTPVVEQSEIVLIAVKPSIVPIALEPIKSVPTSGKLFLSIAMGVTIHELEQLLFEKSHVMRVMPNTAALVQQAASVFVSGTHTTEEDYNITKKLLESIGTCEQVPESYLDAITALSGSGTAYIFVLIEALADGAVRMGLPRDLAYRLASQTVLGAGTMVRETNIHPAVLKDNVTSPAGSTAAGLCVLEQHSLRAAVIKAIEAATETCRKISGL